MRERHFGRIVWAIPLIVIQVPRVIFKGKHRDVGGLEFHSGGTEVKGAIERLEEGRTVVCVAHRLSTLRGMDKIMVLETGRVEEKGTFDELLEHGGVFAAMACKQGIATQAETVDLEFKRVQLTHDLMSTDITGTEVIYQGPTTYGRQFKFLKGYKWISSGINAPRARELYTSRAFTRDQQYAAIEPNADALEKFIPHH